MPLPHARAPPSRQNPPAAHLSRMTRFHTDTFTRILATLAAAPLLLSSCSTTYWSQNADDEVYDIIESREVSLFGSPSSFDITTPHSNTDPDEIQAVRILSGRRTKNARHINLSEAIALSIQNSRDYQTQKENLYLAGIELTRARHDFAPTVNNLSTGVSRDDSWTDGDHTDSQLSIPTRAGFDQMLKSGGSIAIDLAQNIFRFYLGDTVAPSTTFLAARLNQPLLRGRGAIATENLTQSERDVAYAIRSFSRFQKRHALDIAGDYFDILEQKDKVRNEYSNYRNLITFTQRATELARDRLPKIQVDQARQDELSARNRYINAIDSYRSLVDSFKLELGLPLGGELTLDDSVLDALTASGLTAVPLAETNAIDIAVANRLDLLNEVDRFEDAQRKVTVAADSFKPGLNLFADLSMQTRQGRNYSNFNPESYHSAIGLELDIPTDNLDARNTFRRAQISFQRQLRNLALAIDQIHFDVRSGLRGLELARQSHLIQQNALRLANQRVEAVNLLLETDRAETRDLLEARSDQLSAKNSLTSALIDYHLTRLEFLYDLGIFNPEQPEFWVKNPKIPSPVRNIIDQNPVSSTETRDPSLITPEDLFNESTQETLP